MVQHQSQLHQEGISKWWMEKGNEEARSGTQEKVEMRRERKSLLTWLPPQKVAYMAKIFFIMMLMNSIMVLQMFYS